MAARALKVKERLYQFLSATQLGITLASLGLGWLGEPALAGFIEPPLRALGASESAVHAVAYALAFGTISIAHIVLGELVPKSLAIQRPELVATLCTDLLRAFYAVTWPAMWLLNGLSMLVLWSLGLKPTDHGEGKLSPEEIRLIIQMSFGHEDEQSRKRDLLERVLRGTDRPAWNVMVPRVDMVVLSTKDTVESSLEHVKKAGYSRYPLCEEGNPDRVVGYVHVKDLLLAAGGSARDLLAAKRDVLFVPGTAKVGDMLSQFQLTSIPLAIVVDEYGGTDGLVTVEDVVEEMVGEIQDEHDVEAPRVVTRPDGSVSVDASVPLSEIEGATLADDGDVLVGAFVLEKLGRLPRAGDQIRAGNMLLTVETVRRRRVRRVLFTPRTATEPPPPPPDPKPGRESSETGAEEED